MLQALLEKIHQRFGDDIQNSFIAQDQITLELHTERLHPICLALRDDPSFQFTMLIDICGIDYLYYGHDEWKTNESTSVGFSRGVESDHIAPHTHPKKTRFAVIYHLLSIPLNQRIRLRCFLQGDPPIVDSVIEIWPSANWFEREAFDLYGIIFDGHPDLRRILTDYGFIGHPFRKDFPVSGHVEVRYDAKEQRVLYEPVDLQPRVLVPKVIRAEDSYPSKGESDAGNS